MGLAHLDPLGPRERLDQGAIEENVLVGLVHKDEAVALQLGEVAKYDQEGSESFSVTAHKAMQDWGELSAGWANAMVSARWLPVRM